MGSGAPSPLGMALQLFAVAGLDGSSNSPDYLLVLGSLTQTAAVHRHPEIVKMSSRSVTVLVAMLALSSSTALFAQDHPDFSGTWKFDLTQSSGPVIPPPAEVSGRASAPRKNARPGAAVGRTPVNDPDSRAGLQPSRPGPATQTLEINLKGDNLKIDQTTNDIKEKFSFKLDGSENKNSYYVSGVPVEVKSTARWDGPNLVIDGSGIEKTSNGTIVTSITQTISLSEDGGTLTIDHVMQSTRGRVRRVYVYTKQ